MKQEVKETKQKYESTNLQANNMDREIENAKKMAYKTQEDAEKKLEAAQQEIARTK